MNNIIVDGKQVVIFDTGNNEYDTKLKDLVECFMKVKTSLFRNEAIKKGLINAEIEDIDYTVLSEAISKFLGNNISCFILKKEDFQRDIERSFLIHPDKLKVTSGLNNCHDMNSFTEKYNEYTNFKQEFYESLEHFMMNPKYKGNVDINDDDWDDGLNIQISPANRDDDEWFEKYHEEFCDKFQVQLMKAINVCNGGINYIYKLK